MEKSIGLFEQVFKLGLDFNTYQDFEAIMINNFNLSSFQAKFLYEVKFSYEKKFLYHDLDILFDTKSEFHDFLANPLIVFVN